MSIHEEPSRKTQQEIYTDPEIIASTVANLRVMAQAPHLQSETIAIAVNLAINMQVYGADPNLTKQVMREFDLLER